MLVNLFLSYNIFLKWDLRYSSEKAMAPHSSNLAWKIPSMDGGVWKAEVHGVAEGWTRLSNVTVTFHFHFHFSLSCIGEGNSNPLQCSCLENPRDGGAWWAAVYGVAQSWTRLKRLSSSSSKVFILSLQIVIVFYLFLF